jgi:hypothetical membrane protein
MNGQPINQTKLTKRNVSIWRKLLVFGMLAPLVYLSHVVIGGLLWKGYSHLEQPISDLTSAVAPDRVLLNNIMYACGLFSMIFFISVFMYLRKVKSKALKTGTVLLIVFELISISYLFFLQDEIGSKLTFAGLMHLVVTGLIVPVIIAAPIFLGIGFRKLQGFKSFSIYSIFTSVFIFITGGTSVIVLSNKLHYFGVWERLNMASIYLWIFLLALKLFRTDIIETSK